MSEPAAARPRPWTALAFVVVLALVIQSNLRAIVANQSDYDPRQRPGVKPRDIGEVALRNPWNVIQGAVRWYYQMRRLGAGTTIVVPPELESERFYLEEVSRLRVEVAPDLPPFEPAFLDHVPVDVGCDLDGTRRCAIAIDPGATRYVIVRTPDLTRYLILSQARFDESLAWYRAVLPSHG